MKALFDITTHDGIQLSLCQHLRKTYPNVIFTSDGAGVRMHPVTAKRYAAMQYSRAIPDMFIALQREPFGGLYLEIKRERAEVYKKSGGLKKNDHTIEQYNMLRALNLSGYAALFGFGFDHCKYIVDMYLTCLDITSMDALISQSLNKGELHD